MPPLFGAAAHRLQHLLLVEVRPQELLILFLQPRHLAPDLLERRLRLALCALRLGQRALPLPQLLLQVDAGLRWRAGRGGQGRAGGCEESERSGMGQEITARSARLRVLPPTHLRRLPDLRLRRRVALLAGRHELRRRLRRQLRQLQARLVVPLLEALQRDAPLLLRLGRQRHLLLGGHQLLLQRLQRAQAPLDLGLQLVRLLVEDRGDREMSEHLQPLPLPNRHASFPHSPAKAAAVRACCATLCPRRALPACSQVGGGIDVSVAPRR